MNAIVIRSHDSAERVDAEGDLGDVPPLEEVGSLSKQ